ncbi:MAG: PEP-CTERM system TPR-repeat protein PrsT [Aquabacterium sp.]|nr:PEP-CTERM system TPR-repeat protein PrsT [Aquabacterium sp.]
MACSAIGLAVLLGGCGEKGPDELLAAARESAAKGDRKGAVVTLRAALQNNPESVPVRLEFGRQLLAAGEGQIAEIELRKLQTAAVSPAMVVPDLARAMLAQRKYAKLIAEFESVRLDQPVAMADLQASLATAYGWTGDTARSRERVDAALKLDPKHVAARLVFVRLEAGRGAVSAASALLEEVLRDAPGNADAWQLKGDLNVSSAASLPVAVEAYTKVIALDPYRTAAHGALIGIHFFKRDLVAAQKQLDDLKRLVPNAPQTVFFEAQIAYIAGDFRKAKELVGQLLKVFPDSIGVLQFAGATELRLGAWLQAEAHLGRVLSAVPDAVAARRLLTQVYVQTGQSARALEIAQPNVQRSDPDPETVALVAEAHLQRGERRLADEYFQRALKLRPDDFRIRTAAALSRLAKGETEQGYSELTEIAAKDPDTLADKALISAKMARNEIDDALVAIDRLAAKLPNSPLAPTLRGQALLTKKDNAGARSAFEQALAKNGAYFPAASALASLDLADGKPDAAMARFEAVLKVDPKHLQAQIAIAELMALRGAAKEQVVAKFEGAIRTNPSEYVPRKLLVHYLLARRDYKAALVAAQAGVTSMPSNADLLDSLGQAHLAAGEVNQALNAFGKALAQRPNAVPVLQHLAATNMLAGNQPAAEANLRRALVVAPTDISVQRELVSLYLKTKQKSKATALVKTIQAQQPSEAIGYFMEGDILLADGNTAGALAAFELAKTKRNPGLLPSRIHLVLTSTKRVDEAKRFADEWRRQHPEDKAFIQYLGDVALAGGNLAESERNYQQLVALGEPAYTVLNNLAWILLKRNAPEALPLAERAAAMAPDRPEILDTFAQALLAQQKYPQAIEVGRRVVLLAPSVDQYKLSLAKILIAAGEKAQARQLLEQLKTASPRNAEKWQVDKMLSAL